jgi:hypothetical protein
MVSTELLISILKFGIDNVSGLTLQSNIQYVFGQSRELTKKRGRDGQGIKE